MSKLLNLIRVTEGAIIVALVSLVVTAPPTHSEPTTPHTTWTAMPPPRPSPTVTAMPPTVPTTTTTTRPSPTYTVLPIPKPLTTTSTRPSTGPTVTAGGCFTTP